MRLPVNAKGPSTRTRGVLAGLALAGSALVQVPTMTRMFAPDDFIILEQVTGVHPIPMTLWRLLSGRVFFGLMFTAFGTMALPYHVTVLLAHLVNVVLIILLARRLRCSFVAGVLAATLFGGSALWSSVLLQATGIGEVLAATFSLAALLVLLSRRRTLSLLSVPLFVCAVLCKEIAVVLPVLVLLIPHRSTWTADQRRATGALVLASLGLAGALAWQWGGVPSLHGEAYRLEIGAIPAGLVWYLARLFDLQNPSPDLALPPGLFGSGLLILGASIGALLLALRRENVRSVTAIGSVAAALLLLPALPLVHHRYVAYLYSPCAALALAAASLVAPREGRSGAMPTRSTLRGANTWTLAATASVLFVLVASSGTVSRRMTEALPGYALPSDPLVRKMVVADAALRPLLSRLPDTLSELVVFSPHETGHLMGVRSGGTTRHAGGHAPNLTTAVLDSGAAIRVYRPALRRVEWISEWRPQFASQPIALQEGLELRYQGIGPSAHMATARSFLARGLPCLAADYLRAVQASADSNPALRDISLSAARRCQERSASK